MDLRQDYYGYFNLGDIMAYNNPKPTGLKTPKKKKKTTKKKKKK
jgi:hypothetical protein